MPEKTIDEKLMPSTEDIANNAEISKVKQEQPEIIDNNLDNSESLETKSSVVSEKVPEKIKPYPASTVRVTKNDREKKIENILELDLSDVFMKLPPDKKNEFKLKGEETAIAINTLLDSVKVKAKKVLLLIKNWLKIIPSVNKFFIEQLAKSKLDEIMKLRKK